MSRNISISTLLFCDLVLFCLVILSHPLYFSYFVFFLPYILKLVSFIYPLFITTFLVLFVVLTGHSKSKSINTLHKSQVIQRTYEPTEPPRLSPVIINNYDQISKDCKNYHNPNMEVPFTQFIRALNRP